MAMTAGTKISMIGVPTDVGAGARGGSMGPEALRVAKIATKLRNLGMELIDEGNIRGPVNPQLKADASGHRHLEEVAVWCERLRDQVYESMSKGRFPMIMGGDHSMFVGSIAGVSKYCSEKKKKLKVLWLDAHADFNTEKTSPSGNVHGMPVAISCGLGPKRVLKIGHKTPILGKDQIIQIGIRSVDAEEKLLISDYGIKVYDMRMIDEMGMKNVMSEVQQWLKKDCDHLHVSFDVDFLDPLIAPGVATTVQGGPNYREAQLCMEMIHDSGLMGSLDIMELNPAFDEKNKTAKLAIELVESLFGKQILARPHAEAFREFDD